MFGNNSKPAHSPPSKEDNSPANEVRPQRNSIPAEPWDSNKFCRCSINRWIQGKQVALVESVDEAFKEEPAYWVAGSIFSGLLGLRAHTQPEVGSEVLVMRSENKGENYILGTLPHATGDAGTVNDQDIDTLADTPAAQAVNPSSGFSQRSDITSRMDRVGGEFDLMNAQSVGVSFLQNLVRVRASELAMVECHLMDDLVRIVSDNFQHVSAFGDFTVKNDGGRPTVIWKGSSKLYETEGRDGPDEELEDPENWLESKAKARFQSYVGHLGNMLHMFVTEPQDTLNKTIAGRFRAHVNEDGSFLMQSFGDIAFEKTFAVQVPIQKFLEENPEGDNLAELEYTPHPALQDWVPSEPEGEFFYEAYKLRDYTRWLNNWYSLAQFHRSPKDYRVPTEAEAKAALTKDFNKDLERKNAGSAYEAAHNFYLDVYSTIRIFKDGSILLYDGYGSSVHLGGGDVTMSASRHLRLESAGDMIITGGRDITVKAGRNFDLAALKGGITMRARRWFRALAERAEMLLESLATTTTLNEEGTGAKHALSLRAVYGDVHIRSLGELILSTATNILQKAQGLLIRTQGLRVETDADTNNELFAVSQQGTAAKSLRVASIIDCAQVRVANELPIPGAAGLSAVQQASDDPPTAEEIFGGLDENLELVINIADNDSLFPYGSPEFKHHNEFSKEVLPRSVTQSTLQSGKPPTMVSVNYESLTSDMFDLSLVSGGSVYPGGSADEKVFETENPPLHAPSSKNKHSNTSGILVDKPYIFYRINDN